MGSQFGICLLSRKRSNMKIIFALLLTVFAWTYAFEETIDEFNDEFNIIVDEDLKAAEEQRLKEIESKINEHNKKFAKGEATFGEKLYAFSDLAEEEIENKMMGLTGWDPKRGDAPPERAFGLIMLWIVVTPQGATMLLYMVWSLLLEIRATVALVRLLLLLAFMRLAWPKLEHQLQNWICLNNTWLIVVIMEIR